MGNTSGKPVVFTDEGELQDPGNFAMDSGSCTSSHRQEKFNTNCVPVNLNHFRLLRVVGKGAFGKVRIVERKDTGLTFALKYIRKDEGRWHATRLSSPASLACGEKARRLRNGHSRTIRERAEHHTRAPHARAPQSPLSLQSPLQLPGCRIPVRQLINPFTERIWVTHAQADTLSRI